MRVRTPNHLRTSVTQYMEHLAFFYRTSEFRTGSWLSVQPKDGHVPPIDEGEILQPEHHDMPAKQESETMPSPGRY